MREHKYCYYITLHYITLLVTFISSYDIAGMQDVKQWCCSLSALLYSVSQKSSFLKLFALFLLKLSVFPWNLASMLLVYIHTYLAMLVDLSYYLTKWRFYRAACNADAVLWWEFCPSVCLSVCPSVTRVYCDKTVERSVQIYIPYERTFSLVFWEEEWLVGGDPFYMKFWVNRPPFERNRRFWTDNRS